MCSTDDTTFGVRVDPSNSHVKDRQDDNILPTAYCNVDWTGGWSWSRSFRVSPLLPTVYVNRDGCSGLQHFPLSLHPTRNLPEDDDHQQSVPRMSSSWTVNTSAPDRTPELWSNCSVSISIQLELVSTVYLTLGFSSVQFSSVQWINDCLYLDHCPSPAFLWAKAICVVLGSLRLIGRVNSKQINSIRWLVELSF